jgi:hypothetical protein
MAAVSLSRHVRSAAGCTGAGSRGRSSIRSGVRGADGRRCDWPASLAVWGGAGMAVTPAGSASLRRSFREAADGSTNAVGAAGVGFAPGGGFQAAAEFG